MRIESHRKDSSLAGLYSCPLLLVPDLGGALFTTSATPFFWYQILGVHCSPLLPPIPSIRLNRHAMEKRHCHNLVSSIFESFNEKMTNCRGGSLISINVGADTQGSRFGRRTAGEYGTGGPGLPVMPSPRVIYEWLE